MFFYISYPNPLVIIKSRIKDEIWDDVEQKEKPHETANQYKKQLVLNSEKSKLSLAEIYEQDFLNANSDPSEKDHPDKQKHDEIKDLMYGLFNKLDALTNFSFVPRPAAPEIKIVANVNSINTQEVGQSGVDYTTLLQNSSNTQLAPEEISKKNKASSNLKSKEEMSKTEKNHLRRDKKRKQKAIAEAERSKGNPNSQANKKKEVSAKNQKLTSKAFFESLQEDKMVEERGEKIYGNRKRKTKV